MVEVSRGKPTEERRRQMERGHATGQFFSNIHDSKPPEEGVTLLVEPLLVWSDELYRWRYRKDAVVLGKRRGGQFAKKAPPHEKQTKKRSRA